ncbi:bifunctional diguanylate cyclase/phosphodiesterase [Massilia litorea]|uniref:EAL domain-containing protein n=1 Tax=Massilia litorea TaxID=2769491 RepID=A0A7L9U3E8_9BURK|nr:EAL domain-containing protein [Massilia litorea]QOL49477.1 EAL domain-containing protein [Massilia litorea]
MTDRHPSAPSAAPPPKPGPYPPASLSALVVLLILTLVLGTAAMLKVSYEDTMRQQKTTLRNLAIAFAAQTEVVAQAVDETIRQVQRSYASASGQAPVRLDYFDGQGVAREYLLGLYVFDLNGRPLASATPAGAAVRAPAPAAPVAAVLRDDAMHVAITSVDKATGRGVINVAGPLRDAAGRPAGSVLAQVDSERFEDIYSLVELGKGGSVTLLHRDGTMLVRGPTLPSNIGRSFIDTPLFQQQLPASPRGAFEAASPVDGLHRIYGYDAVRNHPLVIITGMNKSVALASWYGRLWTAVSLVALICLTLVFLAWRVARDTRQQHALIARLEASEARAGRSAGYLAAILNAVRTPIWVLDSARRLVMWNDAFTRFVGRAPAEMAGHLEGQVLDPGGAAERERRYALVMGSGRTDEALATVRDGSGDARSVIQQTAQLLDASGQVQLVNLLTDITERERAEAHLAYLANFDALTGLPNQNHFRHLLGGELADAAAKGTLLGTLVVSLARLHEISDLLGHEAGEAALREVGALFQSQLPRAAGVARIKGNEFAVVVHAHHGRGELEEFAQALHRRLSSALTVNGREFFLGPRFGVSVFPEDGQTADELFRRAESARNRIDLEGDAIHFFSESAQIDLDERLTVEAQLRRALERGELRMVYQPKVALASGRIVGFEALLRWQNAELGEVSPVRFIPLAERTGLIVPIGAWVLHETCRQLARWNAGGARLRVAVNLSPRQFDQKDLVPMMQRCIEETGVDAGCLEFEITETALMSREVEVDALLHAIRALGVELSIDDFGTGYSSLAALKRFPVQRLKIDRAFIRDLGRDEDSAAIVRSIVNLARNLKLAVVAEGVETEEQLAILRGLACDDYQGFLFSRPVEADVVPALIEANRAVLA